MTNLFVAVKIRAMQSKKASKKTVTNAEETGSSNPDKKVTSEASSKPRTTRSSKPKSEPGETIAAKRHRAVTPAPSQVSAPAIEVAPKAMAAAAGASASTTVSSVIDSSDSKEATYEEIANLAHSYWVARGHHHGWAEEDWLRAERELKSRR